MFAKCEACGALTPPAKAPVSERFDSSPGCMALFNEILAREFSDRAYWPVHHLTVSSYALQHPPRSPERARRTIALNLMNLYLVFERAYEPEQLRPIMRALTHRNDLPVFEAPADRGSLTVSDAWRASDPQAYLAAVRTWAWSVWTAWSAHHGTVAALASAATGVR